MSSLNKDELYLSLGCPPNEVFCQRMFPASRRVSDWRTEDEEKEGGREGGWVVGGECAKKQAVWIWGSQ